LLAEPAALTDVPASQTVQAVHAAAFKPSVNDPAAQAPHV
jgi:hypothetical protein